MDLIERIIACPRSLASSEIGALTWPSLALMGTPTRTTCRRRDGSLVFIVIAPAVPIPVCPLVQGLGSRRIRVVWLVCQPAKASPWTSVDGTGWRFGSFCAQSHHGIPNAAGGLGLGYRDNGQLNGSRGLDRPWKPSSNPFDPRQHDPLSDFVIDIR